MFGLPCEALEFESRVAEVDQEPNLDSRGVEVVDDLSFMLRGDGLDRLELDKHFLFDEEIGVEIAYGLAPEVYGNGSLRLYGMPSIRKRNEHGVLVYRLQKACTKLVYHLKRTPNDRACQLSV